MTDIALHSRLSSLPADLKAQVVDFIDFLLQQSGAAQQKQQPENNTELTDETVAENKLLDAEFERVVNRVRKPVQWEDLHGEESRKALKDYNGSFSDAVIEERRAAL